jgi:TolA-binding protein
VSALLPDDLPPGWEDLGREDAEALSPPDGAKERVGRRVAATLGLGAGIVAATAASTTAAAAGVAGAGAASSAAPAGSAATGLAGTLLAKKIVLVGVAAAVGIGGGTAALLEVRSERERNRPAAVVQPARPSVARPQTLPPPEPSVESAPPDTLGEERTLLDRARMDIGSGDLAGAGALLTRHAAQFPEGRLAEEREALVIRLLVRQGRDTEARAHAARFRREHPRSIQLPGIADALREGR